VNKDVRIRAGRGKTASDGVPRLIARALAPIAKKKDGRSLLAAKEPPSVPQAPTGIARMEARFPFWRQVAVSTIDLQSIVDPNVGSINAFRGRFFCAKFATIVATMYYSVIICVEIITGFLLCQSRLQSAHWSYAFAAFLSRLGARAGRWYWSASLAASGPAVPI
jgi:hypothetical protein